MKDDCVDVLEGDLVIHNSHVGWQCCDLEGTETVDGVLSTEEVEVVVILAADGSCGVGGGQGLLKWGGLIDQGVVHVDAGVLEACGVSSGIGGDIQNGSDDDTDFHVLQLAVESLDEDNRAGERNVGEGTGCGIGPDDTGGGVKRLISVGECGSSITLSCRGGQGVSA